MHARVSVDFAREFGCLLEAVFDPGPGASWGSALVKRNIPHPASAVTRSSPMRHCGNLCLDAIHASLHRLETAMKLQRMLIGTMAALAFATAAAAQPVQERNGILTSATGHTLYVNGIDAPGRSNCNGACARAWPPYLAREGAQAVGATSIVTRDDGALQWAYAGRPLLLGDGCAAGRYPG